MAREYKRPERLRDRLNPKYKGKKRPEPVNALLWIDDTPYRLLEVEYGFMHHTDGAGRAIGDLCLKPFIAVIKPIKDHGRLVRLAWSNLQTFNGRVEHFHMDGVNKVHRDTIIHNAFITGYRDTNGYYELPFERVVVLRITPQYLKINDAVYESSMNPSRPMEMNPPGLLSRDSFREDTVINRVSWKNSDTGDQDITEIGYEENASLTAEIENPIGSTATITITKKDGSEFENGQKELSFTETISGGSIELTPMEIKAQWEDFKTADVDELVARVSNNGVNKRSAALRVAPKPKVIVDFRPSKAYDGEYGFDYMRDQTDKLDAVSYKTIMGRNTRDANGNDVFTPYRTDTKYNSLRDDEYTTLELDWYKDAQGNPIPYIVSWLTIYPGDTHTLSLQIDTIAAPKVLTLEYDKKMFTITPDTIPAQAVGTKKRLDDHITIQCHGEFDGTEYVKVMDGNRQLGQLNIHPNGCEHRYQAKVVFVKVETDIQGAFQIKTGNTNNKSGGTEADMFTRYLRQALTKLELDEVEFKLTADATGQLPYPNFNRDYTLLDSSRNPNNPLKILNKYHNTGGDNLVTFMETAFTAAHPEYTDHYKIFFFGDNGGRQRQNGTVKLLAGYAKDIDSKAAVMFAGKRKATCTHEALHCMGLRHSFSNTAAYGYKKKATTNIMDYATIRKQLWLWQWKKLWTVLDKEEHS